MKKSYLMNEKVLSVNIYTSPVKEQRVNVMGGGWLLKNIMERTRKEGNFLLP